MVERINPKELIDTVSVEEFCAMAEKFYQSISDHTPEMAKPFSSIPDVPDLLCRLGLLLSGLKLGKSMIVLDFGAGTCWLSRLLNQLQCITICVDCSITALTIGKKLFETYPLMGTILHPPKFLSFNGHSIDIEDESVDRIICFDTFHHIPNQKEVLREFFRVLKSGGIAGFCEPGPYHSQSPQAQHNMKTFCVLENDILLDEIKRYAEDIGFSNLYLKLYNYPELDLDYNDYFKIKFEKNLPTKIMEHLFISMDHSLIFFLNKKGEYNSDSRSHVGLKHTIEVPNKILHAKLNTQTHFNVTISNVGTAIWLNENIQDIGVVKLGIHLFDSNKKLITRDYYRDTFDRAIIPGQTVMKNISLTFKEKGEYYLAIDLVSEFVCWFEDVGSKPALIKIIVT